MNSRFRCRHWRRLFSVLILTAVSVWVVAPVLQDVGSLLPIRIDQVTSVPVFNAWAIWWNADRILHGFSGYWDAPVFFPDHSAFAFSEPQPATVVVAPVLWLTGSPAAAYNVYLLLSLCLNAIVTWLVLRRNGASHGLATIGGIMMAWLPVSLGQIEVLQLIPVWPLIWTWDVLRRHGKSPSWRTAVESAIAYTVSFYTSIHHTLFLSVVLAGTAWVLFSASRTFRFWMTSLAAAVLATVLVGIAFVPMRQALDRDEFERSRALVTSQSARPMDLFLPPHGSLFHGTDWRRSELSPGWLKMALAGVGILLGCCRRKRRRWTLFLALTVVLSGLLALGPNLRIGAFQPWWALAEWGPGISKVRNVFRFAYLMQMAVILLSVTALSEMWLRLKVRLRRPVVATVVLSLVGLLAVAEVPPPRPLPAGVPDLSRHRGWAEFVKQNTPEGMGIACLPFAESTRVVDFGVTTRWMYIGTLHGVPLLNGYSGFLPEAYTNLQTQITDNGLNGETLSLLARMKAHFLVVQRSYAMPEPAGDIPSSYELHHVYEDPVGVDVYELVRIGGD
jgi:hypothetical protein